MYWPVHIGRSTLRVIDSLDWIVIIYNIII